jgi:hypothetical protein
VTAIHIGLATILSVCAFLSFFTVDFGDTQAYQAVKGAINSYDVLIDFLELIEHFLRRLDIYSKIPPTVGMTEMIIKILVELLSTLAVVTKHIKQGRSSESVFGEISYN